jgi:hypothetical protein
MKWHNSIEMFIPGRQYRALFETMLSIPAPALATPTIHASNKLTNDIQGKAIVNPGLKIMLACVLMTSMYHEV